LEKNTVNTVVSSLKIISTYCQEMIKSNMAWPSFSTQRPLLYKKCVYSNLVNAWKKESEKKNQSKPIINMLKKMFLYVCCIKDILAFLKIILGWKNSKFSACIWLDAQNMPKCIYNPIMGMGFSAMFTFQLENTKR